MDTVTKVCLIAGVAALLFSFVIAWRKGDWSTSWFPLATAVLLMTVSLWKSIEFSPDSLKLLKATAAAADSLAAQTQQTAKVAQTTQTQVTNLTSLLERKNVLQSQEVRPIQLQLKAAPQIDTATITRSRGTFKAVQTLKAR